MKILFRTARNIGHFVTDEEKLEPLVELILYGMEKTQNITNNSLVNDTIVEKISILCDVSHLRSLAEYCNNIADEAEEENKKILEGGFKE